MIAIRIALLLTLCGVVPPAAAADRFHLKNGTSFEVDGWGYEGDDIVYDRGGTKHRVPKGAVERIVEGTQPIPRPPASTAQPPAALRPCDPFNPFAAGPCARQPTASERCAPRRPQVGDAEQAIYEWGKCLGYVLSDPESFRVTTTQTRFGIARMYTVGSRRWGTGATYIHTQNGVVTSVQFPER